MKPKKNQGFTLVEMVIVISIFAVLLGILIPSMNPILGFEAQRATQSICASLDEAKREAMSRLVGEMKLSYTDSGYFVTYYLDRGKGKGLPENEADTGGGNQPEQVAKRRAQISYLDSNNVIHNLKDGALILTYSREDGGFRPIQTSPVSKEQMDSFLAEKESYEDLKFNDLKGGSGEAVYCKEIIITCGMRSRKIILNRITGTYTVRAQ